MKKLPQIKFCRTFKTKLFPIIQIQTKKCREISYVKTHSHKYKVKKITKQIFERNERKEFLKFKDFFMKDVEKKGP